MAPATTEDMPHSKHLAMEQDFASHMSRAYLQHPRLLQHDMMTCRGPPHSAGHCMATLRVQQRLANGHLAVSALPTRPTTVANEGWKAR